LARFFVDDGARTGVASPQADGIILFGREEKCAMRSGLPAVRATVLLAVFVVTLLLLCPTVSGQDDADYATWEFKIIAFKGDDKDNAKRLAELSADGWEYVGPVGKGTAFKRRVLSAAQRAARKELQAVQGTWKETNPKLGAEDTWA
jgi:hypothetical protein